VVLRLAGRLLSFGATLLAISLVTFLLLRLTPGDPAALAAARGLRPGQMNATAAQRFRAELGLDRPIGEQWVAWLRRSATFDFGTSWRTGRPVIAEIGERLPATVGLNAAALLFACLAGIAAGVLFAARRGRALDRIGAALTFLALAMPSFALGTAVLLLFGGGKYWDLIPVQGLRSEGFEAMPLARRIADLAWHAAAPVVVLAYGSLASFSRTVRAGMVEALQQDYVLAARARGLSERAVLFRHALRNSLLPLLSQVGLSLPALVSGSAIIERLFDIPGVGHLLFEAVLSRDYAVIMGVVTVVAVATVSGMLLADLLSALIDPRLRSRR
jgi:peptide/nickel transport system permease protein